MVAVVGTSNSFLRILPLIEEAPHQFFLLQTTDAVVQCAATASKSVFVIGGCRGFLTGGIETQQVNAMKEFGCDAVCKMVSESK